MNKQVIARTVTLFVLLVNQILIMFGLNPLPFSEQEIYEATSLVLLSVASIVTWWENNSFTEEAKQADDFLTDLKDAKKGLK